ncbi:pyridoxamine 5'-phosphate oxidase [Knoellia sinensis KCTC 19936]|uniref:Pyridoxamine 5'-phosphate oxidase n=1 Tax=Knoellia sinensis KCTC 19936 TaxID=1385520 RepID=A0A0A0JBG9_9MICO|nr:pyridoxamine 5'-phosphate oxidase family protein [Knoellia sinensis]KGN34760.1 pyridoxamine 5'-phosphate oxidase [Knoellia sinensis KCTC 19936]
MSDDTDLVEHAHSLLHRIAYVTLGTVDADGRPWTTPVYFAADGLTDFYWTSSRGSLHSENLESRSRISLVVFDSTVPAYHGRAVYAVGSAAIVDEPSDLEHGLTVYPGPESRGGSALTVEDVTGDSPWRLYRARASQVWVLCPREPRQPCSLHGRGDDHRELVHPT